MSKPIVLEFYEDAQLTKRLFSIQSDDPVNVGKEKEFIVYVKNATNDELRDIQFYSDDPDISYFPNIVPEILSHKSIKLSITWKPALDRRTPLKTSIFAYCKLVIRP